MKSYRRACRRALKDGTASYRGGEITSSQAHSSPGYSSVSPPRLHSRSRPSRAATITRRPRRAGNLATALSVMSWNAGGLSAQQWHELQEWAVTCPYHALCIQETHWSGSSQFRARGWHVITSGYPSATNSSSTRSAGVLVMLHPSIPVQDIRWSVCTPGRSHIVHFSFKGSPYAILNCYQHTKHKGATAVEHWATQKQVLDKMSAEIMAVSHRTNLLVTGDFNASISYHPPYTGSGIFRTAKPIGRELFTRFVTNNNLLALNTFTNPLPTYISPTGKSQIDFVLQPAFQATPNSKQVKVLTQFPLGAWRAGGRHRPLATSIVPYAPWVKSPSFRKLTVSSSRRFFLAEQSRRCTPQAHALIESVRRSIEAAKADQGLSFLHPDEVNTIMVEEASRISLHSPSRPEDIPTAQPIWQALRERRRIHRLRLANPASLRLIAAYASANGALGNELSQPYPRYPWP